MRSAMDGLITTFELTNGHTLAIGWSTTNLTLSRIRDGETADMVIATGPGIDELTKQGRIMLSSTLIGIGVRVGAPKPDISSVQAFTRALLAAKSITYTHTLGQSGMHFERVIKRLGIADQLQPKFRVIPGGLVGELVVRGEADLGVQMLPEIFAVKGFELAGPFPPGLQKHARKTLIAFSPRFATNIFYFHFCVYSAHLACPWLNRHLKRINSINKKLTKGSP